MNRRHLLTSIATAGLILMITAAATSSRPVWAAGRQESAPPEANVKIDNFSFGPASLTVTVGTKVTWTNRDDMPHSVVSTEKIFKSSTFDTDGKFSYTFTKAGTYPYFCGLHPKMTGKIIVEQPKGPQVAPGSPGPRFMIGGASQNPVPHR